MALVNHRAREIHFKIVYYGPGLGGKTTNLKVLHDRLPADKRGRLMSIATEHERTLFFDFMAVNLGLVQGFSTRFHLYTVPGQIYYRLSRRAVLQGLDAVVFVADSGPGREAANRDSLADLEVHMESLGLGKLLDLPRVFQWNKRDLPGALPVERLRAALNPSGAPEFEAVASEGRGVAECLRAACKAVLVRLSSPGALPAGVPVEPGAATLTPVPAMPPASAAAVPARAFVPAAVAPRMPLAPPAPAPAIAQAPDMTFAPALKAVPAAPVPPAPVASTPAPATPSSARSLSSASKRTYARRRRRATRRTPSR